MNESLESTLLAAFAGVNAYDPDAIMANWNRDGVYHNPNVGTAAKGYADVRNRMVKLCEGVMSRGEQIIVDRVTSGPRHVIAEWHVEPRNGKDGVHVADFDDDGKLVHVRVFPRG
ncbi:MAG TPA: nuclear transport factor 2 family protein [Tepidisphaeraceae bacterium]|jgi:hypothetical protein|nr:nuclear transport factor 2 family protein [Tepidisphaeraceae bacterium]